MKCYLYCFAIAAVLCACGDRAEVKKPASQTQVQPAVSEIIASNIAQSPAIDIKSCSDIPGYTTEIELKPAPSQKTNILFVTFVGKHPPAGEIDKLLRACLAVASSLDSKWSILGEAFLREAPNSNPNDDSSIGVYEPLEYLSFDPADKTIAVRKMTLGK